MPYLRREQLAGMGIHYMYYSTGLFPGEPGGTGLQDHRDVVWSAPFYPG